jgi:hypothetical protein
MYPFVEKIALSGLNKIHTAIALYEKELSAIGTSISDDVYAREAVYN